MVRRQGRPSLGGEKSKKDSSWRDTKKEIFESEKRCIVATVMEISITVVMSTHIYNFCGNLYLQKQGGPIGLRSTASLANLIMKIWDMAWIRLLKNEGIMWHLYFRYVDDNRLFAPPLKPGWKWENGHFEFTQKSEKEDLSSGLTNQARTTAEFSKAMLSLVNYLEFEGEESGMFHNNRLPTLDTEIWWDEVSKNIKYSFYEKPMCPNIVIQKDTALSENCIRSSLVQEGVRRLLNCSGDLPVIEKQEILSKFASKMLNSKHSVESVKFMLVHSVTRYNEIIRRSNLNPVNPNYKPLHFDQNFKTHERKLSKF